MREAVDHRVQIDKEFDKFLNELNEQQTEEQMKVRLFVKFLGFSSVFVPVFKLTRKMKIF